MNNIINFPNKKDKKAEQMLGFSNLIDKLVIKGIFEFKLTPEEIVAVLANRTKNAAESCLEIEKIKEFIINHINNIK